MRYYWVKLHNDSEWTIGRYEKHNEDGTLNEYPWEIIASDEIFRWDDITELGLEIDNPYE